MPGKMDPAEPPDHWSTARNTMRQLENSAERMSSRWFLGTIGVIAAAALFLLTAIVLAGSAARMLTNAAAAHHAQAVQFETGALQDALTDNAAAARAYSLTREPDLLRVRKLARERAFSHLAILRGLVAGDDEASRLLAVIHPQIERRVQLYDAMIAALGNPSTTPHEAERLKLARASNAQLAILRNRASRDFNTYQNLVIDDMRLSMALALITGIASPICGLVGIHLLRRERESQHARELQLELMHVQRLAIMGETSAMLAHEINQPLTAANNYLSVLRRVLDSDNPEKAKAMADRIDQQIQRAASILRKLRRFIEKREAERRLESPDVLADDAITLLGTIDSSIMMTADIAPSLPRVLVDRVQIQQVLVNLMRNAIEAMQGSEHRELALVINAPNPHTVEISLSDTGPGLTPEVAARLFQPFVSTKSGGMGVGLSICHSIISQHGGRIWAEANTGGGTVFHFTLPASKERAAA
ncbi:hypothetical protein GCM10008941_31020 [Rhizomicrobium palustre]